MRFSQKLILTYVIIKYKFLSALSKKLAASKAFQLFCTPQYRNKKKLPPVFEKAEQMHFAFDEIIIRGYRWNHPSDKKILILHGFESSVVNFDRYIKPLTKTGYEVLAFDAPAHGRSGGKKINAVLYKNLIVAINHLYGPITNFMAHSLGGLALSLYLDETPHDEAFKIVLIAPATETKTAIDSFFRFLRLDSEVRKEFDKNIEKMSGKLPEWFSINRMADNIKASVLWLQDKDDDMTPLRDVAPVIDKNYSNFQFIISEGLGHRRIYRDNKTYKTILKFFGVQDKAQV